MSMNTAEMSVDTTAIEPTPIFEFTDLRPTGTQYYQVEEFKVSPIKTIYSDRTKKNYTIFEVTFTYVTPILDEHKQPTMRTGNNGKQYPMNVWLHGTQTHFQGDTKEEQEAFASNYTRLAPYSGRTVAVTFKECKETTKPSDGRPWYKFEVKSFLDVHSDNLGQIEKVFQEHLARIEKEQQENQNQNDQFDAARDEEVSAF